MIKKGTVYSIEIEDVKTLFIVKDVRGDAVYTDHAVTTTDGGYTWNKSRDLLPKHCQEPIEDVKPVLDARDFDTLFDVYPDKNLYKNAK